MRHGWLAAPLLVGLPAMAEDAATIVDAPAGSVKGGAATHAIGPAEEALLALIPGDAAYGAYLAGECTSCHQPGQANEGVPQVTGWSEEDFALAMLDYRTGLREHPIMNMVAGRLGDEEIAALAAHFAALE